ncbi:MAG: hypothetical protein F6J96_13020 [Symploca sp. SIO1C2]|nr:hypothetical protein [Symploca sp. SIO1C2]
MRENQLIIHCWFGNSVAISVDVAIVGARLAASVST